jgi:ParB-like chromosome segregation protein Spo0J
MADKADKVKSFAEGEMVHVPLRQIIPHDEAVYRPVDKEHVDELRKDIEANGLLSPIIVWNGGTKNGTQVELEDKTKIPATFLVAGLHRYTSIRAIFKENRERYKELFPNGVPVKVISGELKDFLAAQLRENVLRKDMEISQILPVIKKMRDEHEMKQADIARAIGKSKGYVSQIFDAEAELGEEATEELAKEGAKISNLRNAAKEVKEKVKKGVDKKTAAKEVVEKTKSKLASKKASGRQREEKKVSAKKVWERWQALPRGLKMGEKLAIAEAALGYLAGDTEFTLPSELANDVEGKEESED